MSDGSPKGIFIESSCCLALIKKNKQALYATGITGIKDKYKKGHTTVNVWI
ncbi:hypothetical protein LFU01_17170 [Lysinibacillus fusiformis]|nr:hypothetical protein LFU01_17170 [Lysinibacillus fusiformis]